MQDCNYRAFGPLLVVIFASAVGLHGNVYGQDSQPTSALTLEEAIDRALALNPAMRVAGFDIEIERARRDAAALSQPMTVQAEVENFLGSGALSSFDSAETTLQLTKALELGGKREFRTQLGDARIALAETDRMLARLDLAARVTRRYIEMIAQQEALVLAEQEVDLAAATLEIVRQRVDVGRSSDAELATSEIALARAQLNRANNESRLKSAQLSLATLWGAEEPDFEQGAAHFFDLPVVATFDELKSRIAENPDLLRVISERRVIEAERQLADSRRRSDVSLGFGIRHLAQIDDSALVFSVNVPLGGGARSRPQVAATDARLGQLPALIEQRRLEVIAALYGLHGELSFSRLRYTSFRDNLLPRGRDAAALYREGFELGSYTMFEFNQAQSELLALRQEALSAAASYHLTLVDIEQLLGGTYQTGVIQ